MADAARPASPRFLTSRVVALQRDEGTPGYAMLPQADMDRLGVRFGDVLAVTGERRTVARALRTNAGDSSSGVVHLDPDTRANARAAAGGEVRLEPAEAPPARAVALALDGAGGGAWEETAARAREHLKGRAVVAGDRLALPLGAHRMATLRVAATDPDGPVLVGEATALEPAPAEEAGPRVGYADVGGLGAALARIREVVELPLRHPEAFARLGVEPPRGVLLTGPPGCGKTLIARAIASETAARFLPVSGPEVMHRYYGDSEAHLREVFEEARAAAPSVIFFDELDAIAPSRGDVPGAVERRVAAQLMVLLDGLQPRGRVVVIGATNLPDALDPALRRPGRFDREVRIPPPDRSGRAEILAIHTRRMPLAADVSLEELADATAGFVGADLAHLCREAAMSALRRRLAAGADGTGAGAGAGGADGADATHAGTGTGGADGTDGTQAGTGADGADGTHAGAAAADSGAAGGGGVAPGGGDAAAGGDAASGGEAAAGGDAADSGGAGQASWDDLVVDRSCFLEALAAADPAAGRGWSGATGTGSGAGSHGQTGTETPGGWGDVAGCDGVVRRLREALEWPARHPELFRRARLAPPRGILLWGPRGCGKTLLAHAAAAQCGMTLLAVEPARVLSRWVGESERQLRELFASARHLAPCLVLCEDVEALLGAAGTAASGDGAGADPLRRQLLHELDALRRSPGAVFVATARRLDRVPADLLGPGRLELVIEVPLPGRDGREAILRLLARGLPLGHDVDPAVLADLTEGFAGGDLAALCRRASLAAVGEQIEGVEGGCPAGGDLVVAERHFRLALEAMRQEGVAGDAGGAASTAPALGAPPGEVQE